MDRRSWVNDFKELISQQATDITPTDWKNIGITSKIACLKIEKPFRFPNMKDMYIECLFEEPRLTAAPKDQEQFCVRLVYGFRPGDEHTRQRALLYDAISKLNPSKFRLSRNSLRVYLTKPGISPILYDLPVADQLEAVADYARAAQELRSWHIANFPELRSAIRVA